MHPDDPHSPWILPAAAEPPEPSEPNEPLDSARPTGASRLRLGAAGVALVLAGTAGGAFTTHQLWRPRTAAALSTPSVGSRLPTGQDPTGQDPAAAPLTDAAAIAADVDP